MKRKKPIVTGTLQQKADRYYLVFRIPDSSGKLKQKWISTGLPVKGNQRRAKQLLDEKLLELQAEYDRRSRQAGWTIAEVGDIPFSEVVQRWLIRKRSEVAPSTYEGYRHITARLLPYFRQLDLTTDEVSPTVLENYCETLQDDGLSANTVQHHLTLIKSVFNEEIRNGAPLLNPVKCVKAPRVEVFQGETLSIEQIGQLFRLFENDPIEDIVRIAVIYGLRRSEIIGLRWEDINRETNTLHIRHKVAEVRINGKRQLIRSNNLKTEASRRAFPLSSDIRQRLEHRQARIAQNQASNRWYSQSDAAYIFVDANGKLLSPEYVTDHFRWKIAHSDLPKVRFHDLRHTCATLLLHEGCSLREIQSYLGHASYLTTTRYAHVDARSKEHALEIMSAALMTGENN